MRFDKLFAGPIMMSAGILHFVKPEVYEPIMPEYLPAHRELIYASGVAEFGFAAMTLVPATRRAGGWGLIATLVGVFPANLQMALQPEKYPAIPEAALWARLPLQLGMIALVWSATLKRR